MNVNDITELEEQVVEQNRLVSELKKNKQQTNIIGMDYTTFETNAKGYRFNLVWISSAICKGCQQRGASGRCQSKIGSLEHAMDAIIHSTNCPYYSPNLIAEIAHLLELKNALPDGHPLRPVARKRT